MRRCWGSWLVVLVVAGSLASASVALGDGITNSGDDLRTGWYPNAKITPEDVTGGRRTAVVGAGERAGLRPAPGDLHDQRRPQRETVIVATETNWVYGLDPNNAGRGSGGTTVYNGDPWNPKDVGCADISPAIGTTATPVIDPHQHRVRDPQGPGAASRRAAWYLDALDVTTGTERAGFPVKITGAADNDPRWHSPRA